MADASGGTAEARPPARPGTPGTPPLLGSSVSSQGAELRPWWLRALWGPSGRCWRPLTESTQTPALSASVGSGAHTLVPRRLQVPGGGGAPEAPRAAHRASSPSLLPLSPGAPLLVPPTLTHAAGVMLGLRARVVSIAAPARSTRRPRLGEVAGPAQGHTPGGGVRPGSAHAVSRSPDDSASSGSGLGAGKADATLQPEASREPGHSHHVPPREAPLGTRDAALNGKWQPATGLGGRGCWSRGLVRGVTLGMALPSLA